MKTVRCERQRPKRRRITKSITIDPHLFAALKEWMKKEGETNMSAAIEGFIDCGIRETCEGCPNYDDLPEDDKKEVNGKAKVGKWINE